MESNDNSCQPSVDVEQIQQCRRCQDVFKHTLIDRVLIGSERLKSTVPPNPKHPQARNISAEGVVYVAAQPLDGNSEAFRSTG